MCAKDPADRHADAADLRLHIDAAFVAIDRRGGRGRVLRLLGIAAGIAVILTAAGLALLR
jgi:hypothetical protein